MSESLDPDWWVSSGGYFISKDGSGMTVHGPLPADDRWRVAYSISNPIDTEDGYLPQNVFRAVARSKWSDFTQLVYFKIDATNMTDSPNRDAFNGIHLFHRYQDQDNLYYVGVRVDGAAAVKRKLNGKYTTLKYVKIYPGVYDRWANPNLLPQGRWIGLRTVTRTNPDGSVTLSLEIDDGGWTPVLQVTDPAGATILAEGFAGLRTDFLDVKFEGFELSERCGPVTVSPTAESFGASGGTGTVAVTAPADCDWVTISRASWITVVSGASGLGSRSVTYQVASNSKKGAKSRTGTMVVSGKGLTVTQAGTH